MLKHNPKIKIFIPSTFYPEGEHLIRGAEFIVPGASNRIPHKGALVKFKPGSINKLYDGCAAVAFDFDTVLRIRGEQSIYFNVKDKGIVCVAGCCHQQILTFADFARKRSRMVKICTASMEDSTLRLSDHSSPNRRQL